MLAWRQNAPPFSSLFFLGRHRHLLDCQYGIRFLSWQEEEEEEEEKNDDKYRRPVYTFAYRHVRFLCNSDERWGLSEATKNHSGNTAVSDRPQCTMFRKGSDSPTHIRIYSTCHNISKLPLYTGNSRRRGGGGCVQCQYRIREKKKKLDIYLYVQYVQRKKVGDML